MKEDERRKTLRRPVIGYPAGRPGRPPSRLVDVSAGGMGIRLDRPLRQGWSCWIQFGEKEAPIRLGGRVRWCRQDQRSFRAGIELADLSTADELLDHAISNRLPLEIEQSLAS